MNITVGWDLKKWCWMNRGLELHCEREIKSCQANFFISAFIMAQILWLAG